MATRVGAGVGGKVRPADVMEFAVAECWPKVAQVAAPRSGKQGESAHGIGRIGLCSLDVPAIECVPEIIETRSR